MEVRRGYKLTEVGVILEEWEVTSFGNVFSKLNAKEHQIQTSDYQTTGMFPVVDQGKELVVGFSNRQDKCFHCPERGVIVFGDHTCIVKFVDFDFVVGADGTQILATKAGHCARFHAFQLQHRGIPTTGYNRHFKFLKERMFVAPPSSEQRAIAAALSDVDALLAKLDALIAKKRDLKQAAMQQLLTGQTRLPGFSGAWEVKRLGDASPLQRGFDLPTTQLRPGSYPIVYSNGVLNYHACFMVKGPGVVTGRSGTIGNVHFVEDDFWPHNTSLWVTNFKGNSPRFIFYLLTSLGLDRFGTGSGVPTLNRNDVHAYRVRIPPSAEEQMAIAAVLSDMDAEIAALEAHRDKTRARQGQPQHRAGAVDCLAEEAGRARDPHQPRPA